VSVSLETYLVKLYLDRDARRAFLADPRSAARAAGLGEADVAALERVDRDGLELAARSFAGKRAARAAGRPRRALLGMLGRVVARLREGWRRS